MIALGIIPARGGSKSVPLKNIRALCGKPLIAYAIETANKSRLLSKVIVSTENKQIADIAERYGCKIINRPEELATDTASTESALIHAVEYVNDHENLNPDIVVVLEPTAPFRTAELIDRCIEIFADLRIDSAMGVVEDKGSYGRIINDRFNFLFPNQPRRRQERKSLYKESSTIYAVRKNLLMETKSLIGKNLAPVIVTDLEAVDINTEIDFQIAEALMHYKLKRKGE